MTGIVALILEDQEEQLDNFYLNCQITINFKNTLAAENGQLDVNFQLCYNLVNLYKSFA